MVNVTESKKRKYIAWVLFLVTGASYALCVVLIGAFLLFFILQLSGYNLLLALYLGNIPISILLGFSKNKKQLKEFLILFLIGSLICNTIFLIIFDWQNNWFVSPIIILYVILATIELIIVAVITYIIRMKMMKKI